MTDHKGTPRSRTCPSCGGPKTFYSVVCYACGCVNRRRPLQERFLEKVDQSGDCWIWTAARSSLGYGKFCVSKGVNRLAHRVSYQTFVGPVTDDMHVCHHCDNPSCVRPDHLFLGDDFANMRDCRAKGRNPTWRQTACRKGHEYVPGSFVVLTNGKGYPGRKCIICRRNYHREYQRELRRVAREAVA